MALEPVPLPSIRSLAVRLAPPQIAVVHVRRLRLSHRHLVTLLKRQSPEAAQPRSVRRNSPAHSPMYLRALRATRSVFRPPAAPPASLPQTAVQSDESQ